MAPKAGGAYTNAQADIDAQRRALLSAVAQRGDQGLAEIEAQNKAAQSMRTEAVRGIAQQGAGAPAALTSSLQGQAGGVADMYSADAAAAARGLGGAMQTIGAINDNYMQQVSAAVPIAEAVSDQNVKTIEAKAKQEAADRANALKIQELQIAAAEKAAKDEEEAKPADVNQIQMMTGWTAEEQNSMMNNRGYATFATVLGQAQDSGMNAQQTLAALQKANKDLEKEFGHGFGNTLDYVWAQFGNQFAGFDPAYFNEGRARRLPGPDGGAPGVNPAPAPAPRAAAGEKTGPIEPLDPNNREDYMKMREGYRFKMRFPDGKYGYVKNGPRGMRAPGMPDQRDAPAPSGPRLTPAPPGRRGVGRYPRVTGGGGGSRAMGPG